MAWYAVFSLVVCVGAFWFVALTYEKIKALPEGNSDMVIMARTIRDGSSAFLRKEFRTIAVIIILLTIVFSCFVEKFAGIAFLIGAIMSSAVCIIGMKSATYANVRTANTARESKSIGETVKVALMGGSISGLSVQAFGLFGAVVVMLILVGNVDPNETSHGIYANLECNASVTRITAYSLGCSLVAMFNRVAGGNFTKAADISSDILAKIRNDMPEDDSRVPNVIADFVGDNVNDIAGNCSDLGESFVATIAASIAISVIIFKSSGSTDMKLFRATWIMPILFAAVGLASCVFGIWFVSRRKMGDNPSHELNLATYISAGATIISSFFVCLILLGNKELYPDFIAGWISPWVSCVFGIISGVLVGAITEYYTSADYKHTRELANIAPEGTAFVITKGDAIGFRSCLLPMLIIGVALYASYIVCGFYGVALSALGMLSFVGTTVSIDAFGPISDNAGGIAESCHLEDDVRVITDKLDSVGNTTAAIGKGFAIGSAAFATVSLIISYVGVSSGTAPGVVPVLNAALPTILAGMVVGAGFIVYFISLLTNNTIDAATDMADEGSKRMDKLGEFGLTANEATLEQTTNVIPDYYTGMITLATQGALKKMLGPSMLAIVIPIISGLLFGAEFVGGILLGSTIVAIPMAIFMGNSGGAFDNAKKEIEAGHVPGHGKGSLAHRAAVVGDTVGDTRKDVVGVALDIFIKMMSTVANTLAPIFIAYCLFR